MRSLSVTRLMAGALIGMLLVTGVLVLTTGLTVEYFGPVLVYGVALVAVAALLVAPTGKSDTSG